MSDQMNSYVMQSQQEQSLGHQELIKSIMPYNALFDQEQDAISLVLIFDWLITIVGSFNIYTYKLIFLTVSDRKVL